MVRKYASKDVAESRLNCGCIPKACIVRRGGGKAETLDEDTGGEDAADCCCGVDEARHKGLLKSRGGWD